MRKNYFQTYSQWFCFFLLIVPCFSLVACSCNTIPFKYAVERSDEIFIGRIVKAERFANGMILLPEEIEKINYDWKFYFEVTKKWKGNNNAEVILIEHGTSCDFGFDIYEREYLVYASKDFFLSNSMTGMKERKKGLTTWLCSRTTPNHFWEEGNLFEEDVVSLNSEFPNPVSLRNNCTNYWLWGLTFLCLGLIFLVFQKLNSLILKKP